jgi:hypothetical protein
VRLLAFASFLVTALSWPASAQEHSFGRLAPRLGDVELAEIHALTGPADDTPPLAIYGAYSQVLPEVWYVDVFLRPARVSNLVRRGRVVHLECPKVEGADDCRGWRVRGDDTEYAQVASSLSGFAQGLQEPPTSERPFHITGAMSDEDLFSLATYLRTGPGPKYRHGWVGMSLSRDVPIWSIRVQHDRSVEVCLSDGSESGETATVVRRGKGWRVTEVWMWVA